MSNQKPKQQQANLFSFFKKSDVAKVNDASINHSPGTATSVSAKHATSPLKPATQKATRKENTVGASCIVTYFWRLIVPSFIATESRTHKA